MASRALCIGTNKYASSDELIPLHGCVNDAQDVGALLEEHDWVVKVLTNKDADEVHEAVTEFIATCGTKDRALVFLSGHGGEYEEDNYYFPADFGVRTRTGVRDTPRDALAVYREIVNPLKAKNKHGLNIIIADMCRSSTSFRGADVTRGKADGLSLKPAPSGTLVAYACEKGHTSIDAGRNGVFTSVLLNHLAKPVDIGKVFRTVTTEVKRKTADNKDPMQPWVNQSLEGGMEDIVLVEKRSDGGAAAVPARVAPAAAPAHVDVAHALEPLTFKADGALDMRKKRSKEVVEEAHALGVPPPTRDHPAWPPRK